MFNRIIPSELMNRSWAAVIVAGVGIGTTIAANARAKKLSKQRKAYQTPQEYGKILQFTEAYAQQGYDQITLNYLNNQVDRTFNTTIGTATRLGADSNDLSAIFDKKIQSIMQIGANNHALNMDNFSKYLSAIDIMGQNEAAEQLSIDNILKDRLQAAGGQKKQGMDLVNAGLSIYSSNQAGSLYGGTTGGTRGTTGGGGINSNPGNPPSDIRLKENYFVTGKSPSGINIYEFSYKGNSKRYSGVMAHEVMWATQEINGFLHVDYSLTDVKFKEV